MELAFFGIVFFGTSWISSPSAMVRHSKVEQGFSCETNLTLGQDLVSHMESSSANTPIYCQLYPLRSVQSSAQYRCQVGTAAPKNQSQHRVGRPRRNPTGPRDTVRKRRMDESPAGRYLVPSEPTATTPPKERFELAVISRYNHGYMQRVAWNVSFTMPLLPGRKTRTGGKPSLIEPSHARASYARYCESDRHSKKNRRGPQNGSLGEEAAVSGMPSPALG